MNPLPAAPVRLLAGVCLAVLLGACASSPASGELDPEALDTLPRYNRWMFEVNDTLDRAVVKPLAQGYQAVTPQFVDDRITDFFGNLGDVVVLTNNLLQCKPEAALGDLTRIVFNSTFGLLGLFDVATALSISPKHTEDFGQTLGVWGLGEGGYLVLPLLGPSTWRDTAGLAVNAFNIDPVWEVHNIPLRNSAVALRLVDRRADLLRSERVVEGALLDRYTQVRDAYLERRRSLIHDGNPPPPPRRFEE